MYDMNNKKCNATKVLFVFGIEFEDDCYQDKLTYKLPKHYNLNKCSVLCYFVVHRELEIERFQCGILFS